VIWNVAGFLLYFAYGRRNSDVGNPARAG